MFPVLHVIYNRLCMLNRCRTIKFYFIVTLCKKTPLALFPLNQEMVNCCLNLKFVKDVRSITRSSNFNMSSQLRLYRFCSLFFVLCSFIIRIVNCVPYFLLHEQLLASELPQNATFHKWTKSGPIFRLPTFRLGPFSFENFTNREKKNFFQRGLFV